MTQMIDDLLRGNTYPGRGIILGRSYDNKKAILAYFIMGRSENSRNRVFVETTDGIKTQAHDPDKLTNPSLVIYHPLRRIDIPDSTAYVLTNGDQTDTICDYLLDGKTYLDALMTREFEPDPPLYTPRISGLVYSDGAYMLSILKSSDGDPGCCLRHFFTYDAPSSGVGHFIHTYACDGNPPPSFSGEPVKISISDDTAAFADIIWNSLNGDNKVSLFVRELDIKDGGTLDIIKNKNRGD